MKLFNYVQLRKKMMLTDSSYSCIISKHRQGSVLNTLLITKISPNPTKLYCKISYDTKELVIHVLISYY